MTSPEDDSPLPSEPVLTEEETAEQLQRDFCRGYIDEVKRWKARAELVETKVTLELLKLRYLEALFSQVESWAANDMPLRDWRPGVLKLWRQYKSTCPQSGEFVLRSHLREAQKQVQLSCERVTDALNQRTDAVLERDACHKCWDDFTKTVVKALPDMARAPLFSQAERIVSEIESLRRTVELARDALRDISANLTQPPIPLRSGLTAVQLAEICDRAIKQK